MPLTFEFPEVPGLELMRTSIELDTRGCKVSIVGRTSCTCACHSVPVVIRFIVKGKGNEDPARLDWVERMIRSHNPKCLEDAKLAALEMTTVMVEQYQHDNCERKVS